MKIHVEITNSEMDSLKKMLRAALKAAKKAGLDMDVDIATQVENVANQFKNGVLDKSWDPFVVWNALDSITAVIEHVGAWLIQTLKMVKGLGKITAKYDKRIKQYIEYTKNM